MNLTLTPLDFAALSPLLILLGGALLLLLLSSFFENISKSYSPFLTAIVILGALVGAVYAPTSQNALLTPWFAFDSISQLFIIFFLLIGLVATLLAGSFLQKFEGSKGEYFFLLLSALFGLILIGGAADFLILFIGIETLSIALYILCAYTKKWEFSAEAAMKYFFMGSLAAAFLLYGIALIYGATGTTSFAGLAEFYKSAAGTEKVLFLSGISFVTLALAFEAAIVPFQFWAPDVYEGAPMPVTAFMSVGTKVGAFAAFIRVFMIALPEFDPLWSQGIALLAYPTLIYANLVALRQTEMRRFFAYSGISHAGFMLIALAVGTPAALYALLFYLVVYAVATFGSFAVLSFLDVKNEGVQLAHLKGLFRRSPFLASIFSICLLTLAGIPPTVGFFAKFYLFKVAFDGGYYALVILGLATTILSAYYYLRIMGIMFSDAPASETAPARYWPVALMATVTLFVILGLSLYPAPLANLLAGH